ncbi:hypothetical protein PHACT_12690 [Pseudohongiella acticola]|uniref:HTH cro/C1-type domain-containing protein n=1 Tax=Pseudohongiella acticola TaxID=1524254 RepID=A0A1E8CG24_9GAMM|nr:hypothetical protein PHACT_12690 [Pseudohongiella acticola]
MTRTPIDKYMQDKKLSQSEMAAAVGLTQGAISKMILRRRQIFVIESGGRLILVEEKPVAGSIAESSHESVAQSVSKPICASIQ